MLCCCVYNRIIQSKVTRKTILFFLCLLHIVYSVTSAKCWHNVMRENPGFSTPTIFFLNIFLFFLFEQKFNLNSERKRVKICESEWFDSFFLSVRLSTYLILHNKKESETMKMKLYFILLMTIMVFGCLLF